jgi:hypothetical protein
MRMNPKELREREQKVLSALHGLDEDFCFGFQTIMRETGLDRRTVRLTCRRMARKGYTAYHRGLFNDDGEVAGSGYAITSKGRDYLNTIGGPL